MACSVDWQCIYRGAASLQKALKDGDFMAQCMLCSLTELYVIMKAWLTALNTQISGIPLAAAPTCGSSKTLLNCSKRYYDIMFY